MKKKYIYISTICLLLVIGIVVYTTSQSPSSQSDTIFAGETSKVKKQDQERKSTYVIGVSQPPAQSHTYLQLNDSSKIINHFAYPSLAQYDKGTCEYVLAQSISFSEDGKKATIKIDKSKKFSDGKTLTVEDILYSYSYFNAPNTAYDGKKTYQCIEGMKEYQEGKTSEISGIKQIDDSKLEISFSNLNEQILKVFELPILKQSQDDKNKEHIGAGQYVVDEMVLYDHVILTKNTYSSNNTTYSTIKLMSANKAHLNEQTIDTMVINQGQIEEVKQIGAYRIIEASSQQRDFVLFNLDNEIMKELNNRLFIAGAINTDEVMKLTYENGRLSQAIISGDKESPNYRSMLKSNVKGSFEQSVLFQHTYDGTGMALFESLQQQLQKQSVILAARMIGQQSITVNNPEVGMYQYRGGIDEVLAISDLSDFYPQLNGVELKDTFDKLEKYLTENALCIPINNESYYIVELNNRESLNLFKQIESY